MERRVLAGKRARNLEKMAEFLRFSFLFNSFLSMEKLQTCYSEFVLCEPDLAKTRAFIEVAEEENKAELADFRQEKA